MITWFKSLLKKKEASFDPWAALIDASAQTAAGISVSPTSALRCVLVLAGVRVRCETLGSLPLHLYRRQKDGGKERADDHALYRVLHDRPNGWTSAADLIMQLEMDSILYGGAYALANRSGDRIVELIRLQPTAVSVETDDSLEPTYEVTLKNGGRRKYTWRDILHVPALGDLSAIRQASGAIGLCLALEQHGARIFSNGGRPSGVLKYGRRLSKEASIGFVPAGKASTPATILAGQHCSTLPFAFPSRDRSLPVRISRSRCQPSL
ncbi:MAG: phage portal protein [Hyphomicrobiales bacterium]